jgi:transposase-like protein
MAMSLIVDAKKGISAKQVQAHLTCGYKTAWYLCHRIRKAMEDGNAFPTKLSGIVEVDETYIGGKAKRRGVARKPRPKKDMVIGMRERGGRVRFFHVPNLKADTMKKLLDRHIAVDTKQIMTDSAIIYDFAMDDTFKRIHSAVNHSIEWVKPGNIDVHTNTVESAFSLLKRGLIGSFHRVSIKHLHRYLDEFEYRFNRRNSDRFDETLRRMATVKPMPFATLTADSMEPDQVSQ